MGRPTKHKVRYRKTGRKSILTPEMRRKIEEAAIFDLNYTQIAVYCGIDRTSLYNWKEKYPKFFHKIDLLRESPLIRAKKTLYAGVEVDPDLALKLLQNKDRDNYSTKQEQKHTGKLQVEDVTESEDDPEVDQAVSQLEEVLRKNMTKKKK